MNPLFSHLLSHLWQSTLFAALAGLLTLALRSNHARARHWIWLAASMKFLIPFALLTAIGSQAASWIAPPKPARVITVVAREISGALSLPVVNQSPLAMPESRGGLIPAIALTVWLCGIAGVAISWFARWRRIEAALRAASPLTLPLAGGIEVKSAPSLLEPGVFGIFRPVLLLPEGILQRLSPRQLDAILAHEISHIRSRDNLAAAIHMTVEAIFWFHPLVWWLGARLVEERERACDEEVLRSGSAPEVYAESILKVCQFYLESPLACMAGVTGSNLKKRIEEIMTHRVARRLDFGRKLLLGAAGTLAIAAPIAFGLLHPRPARAQSATSTSAPRSFEVASIKPSDPAPPGGRIGVRLMINPGGRFTTQNTTVKMLMEFAYNVRDFQISGGPAWINSERYDVVAKRDDGDKQDPEGLKAMVQSLLADRFQLLIHRESKELPVYALVIGKNGSKLQEGQGDGPQLMMGRGQLTGKKAKMDMLAGNLARQLGRTVIDRTGLTGEYDFKLEWTPDPAQGPGPLGGGHEPPPPADPGGPSIFTAVQEQLGLKLESSKGPVEILVIDKIEKASAN